jgi:predicted alpha/beta-hydrolase family hydrolase
VTARRPKPGALLLAPGAGSSRENPALVAIEQALGLPTDRMDFPYRIAGRRAPDRAPVLIESVNEHAKALCDKAGVDLRSLLLGGRSMGGRMCSMAVAEGLPAAGLILVSYPLHPPGKPDTLRVAHLPALTCPCLFVSGDRDPFATPDELRHHVDVIEGPVTVEILRGGHDLKGRDAEVASIVKQWVASLGRRRPRG